MKDVMIDIETLGTRSTSKIIQIGACYFDRDTGQVGEVFKQNIAHSNDERFTVDWHTLAWWMLQSEEARNSVIADGHPLESVLSQLSQFLNNATYIWSHATFDIPIILHAYDVLGLKFPLHYTKMRDIRTLMDIADFKSTAERTGTHHDALDDCIYQVKYCTEALKHLHEPR